MALYTATATAVGGRKGHVDTREGNLHFDLGLPRSLGGDEKPGATNPEQLFACGYAACFGSAVDHVARQHGVDPTKASVTCSVDLNKEEDGFHLAATLRVAIPGQPEETVRRILEEAHQLCPYSRATRGNMPVTLEAATAEAAAA